MFTAVVSLRRGGSALVYGTNLCVVSDFGDLAWGIWYRAFE